MNMQTFAGRGPGSLLRNAGWAKLGLLCLAGWMINVAQAAPANDTFTNAIVISGASGTTNGSNVGATLEPPCEASFVLVNDDSTLHPVGASIWYAWTPAASGIASFDTIGSGIDTVLSIWTTTNGLCDASLTNIIANDDGGGNLTSALSFPAVAGTTYFVCVEGYDYPPPDTGNTVLNWNEVPSVGRTLSSGTFRFTSTSYTVSELDSTGPRSSTVSPSVLGARVTVTRTGGSSGRVLVDYAVSALTYTNIFTTNYYGTEISYGFIDTNLNIFITNYINTTIYASNSYEYFVGGYQHTPVTSARTNFVTVITNSLGFGSVRSSSGTNTVPTNAPPLNLTTNINYNFPGGGTNIVTNPDGSVNIVITNVFQLPSAVTNVIVSSALGFTIFSGTLAFDDYQMSQDIIVPLNQTLGPDFPVLSGIPSVAAVNLSNPRLDPLESSDLLPPALGTGNNGTLLSALSSTFNPTGASIFNFERSTFRVRKNNNGTNGGNATISVYRSGGNPQDSVTVDYVIDPARPLNGGAIPPPTFSGGYSPPNTFPLQAGSDYATPNSDYTPVTGTLSWGANDYTAKTITIPYRNNGLVEFNEDMSIQLYNPLPLPSATDPGAELGEVNAAALTILFDDTTVFGGLPPGQQPAGAADRSWNMNGISGSIPPFITYPGTAGNGGTVYAVAAQPDGKAIIAGSFNSFDQNSYSRIVRVLPNGYQDPSFLVAPNSGANDFIAALALQPDGKIIIGGNFTSFNGNNRHHIARLNTDGSLDATFNPGLGADGMVWSVALENTVQVFLGVSITNTQIIIGGDFASVNGVNLNRVARLNADGSVDSSFNPGVGPNGTVNAVALDALGRVIIGGNFDAVSGVNSGGVARLNVDGSLDASFAPGIGTFNPETLATDPLYALAVQPNGQILIAGGFSYLDLDSYNGIARLNTDGTVDLSFNPGTGTMNPVTGFSDTIFAMMLQPDGNILIGGDFTAFNQTRRVGVARLFADGSVDTSFMDTAYNEFAGLVNHYHNPDALNNALYPSSNQRNFVYALALESGGNVIIGGSFAYLGGGYTRVDTRPRSNVARLIGNSTPGPGNIQFSFSSYSASKPNNGVSVNSLFISLTRANGNLGIISATFSTNTAAPGPGVAVPGATNDFTLSPQYTTPTWTTAWTIAWMYSSGVFGPNQNTTPVGTGNAYVYVNIFNDGLITGNLNANLALSNPAGNLFTLGGEFIPLGAALGGQTTAPLTIIDDNYKAGVLGFSSPQFTVVEHAGSATITVTRTNGTQNVVQVSYATSNGTATNGIDFTNVTGTLTFNNGDTSKTFTVPIIPGTTVQPDKTVNLILYTPTGGAQLGLTNAVLTIINDNFSAGQISFTSANFSTNETSGTALVTLSRLGGSRGTIKVTLFTAGGSAVPGVDYIGYSNTLTWNDKIATNITVAIPVIHNALATSDRTVNLLLTNLTLNTFPTNACWGPNTNATLTIVNVDSAGTVQFSSPIYSVKKYGGFALIPVVRTGGSVGTVFVNFSTLDGTAHAGPNYSAANGVLTFTNGQIGQFIRVPVVDNGISNGLTFLTLVLSNAQPAYALGNPSNATLNIIDTESVNETPGSGDVTYDALGLNNTVYALALQGNNQLLVGGDFTMADGVPRQRIARFNSDGSVDAGFSLPSSSYGANDSVRAIAVQADGRILVGGFFTNFNSVVLNHIARLNSDGTLDSQFTPGSAADNAVYALTETFVNGLPKILIGGGFATVGGTPINSIARLNSDGSLDTAFNPGLGANATVYALAVQGDGKVVLGGDFTAVNGHANFNHIARLNTDGSVDATFNPGAGAGDSVHAIAIQLDGKILIGGFFTNVNGVALNHIARLNTDGSVDGTFQSGVGASDAVFSIALQADTRIVLAGEFTRCSGVSRSRITRLNPDGTVDPTINFGTGANSFVAAIAIQEDTIFGYPTNVPDEKIIIGGGFTQYNGQPHAYLARIYGGSIGGVGAFEFSSATYQADENSTNVVITILRTGGTSGTNADNSGDIIVPFTTSDGSAVAGTNYLAVTNNLDFPEGEVIRTVTIPVLDDGVITSDLTVNLALNPAPPAAFGDQPTATLTIINDDNAVSFSAATYTVAKNAVNGAATINIVRQGSVSGTSTVFFTTTTNGTAIIGTDYTPVSQMVAFNPGVSNVAVTVPIINNGLAEGNQTVGLQLAGATGSLLYSPSNAVLTIIDTAHSPGQLSFSAPSYVITEGGGVGYTNAYITVLRAFGSLGAVSARFRTMDDTAVAGAKYVATNGVVTFGDGETTPKTFAVQVRNTTTAEGPESLFLLLTNATGGATLAAPTNATLTILNTNIGIAFGAATYATTEPSGFSPGFVTLSVVRFNNTNVMTTVNYSTTNGTATAGTNYVAASGTLTFNPADSVKTITLTLLHDPRVTGDLTFAVGLSSPSGAAQLTPPSVATVMVHDADAGLSFLADAMNVLNNAGFAVIGVTNSNPGAGPVSVNYSTSPGTAVPGVDYTTTSGILTLSNAQAVGFFIVPIISNNQAQGSNRTFTVSLSSPTPPGVLLPPVTETVTIVETNTPFGLSFFSPVGISGDWGSTNVNNIGGAPDNGAPNIAGFAPNAPVWFRWTAPADGEVTLDTIGSLATNGMKLDTVLAVFTGGALNGLNQVAANDDLYPLPFPPIYGQYNYTAQNIFNVNLATISTNAVATNGTLPVISGLLYGYYQPFGGPSGLRFNAKAGATYYIVADSKPNYTYILLPTPPFIQLIDIGRGTISFNWAYHPAGVFRFASENVEQTGIKGTNGNPMLLYQCAETESSRDTIGPVGVGEYGSTFHTTYTYDAPGLLVTVTRVAGSSGRMAVDYATVDGDPNTITNGDAPAVANQDYYPEFGTLVFDDFEMSKTILIQIIPHTAIMGLLDTTGLAYEPNRDFKVVLSNPRPDPVESTGVSNPRVDVSVPRVDSIFGQALCRILDCDIDPDSGPSQMSLRVTNINSITLVTNIFTNIIYSLTPTNPIFNFQKTSFRVARDVRAYWGTAVGIYVNRTGTNTAAATVHYRIDSDFLDNVSGDYENYYFPLQPGSDYANPFTANTNPPVVVGTVYQSPHSDFNPVNGASGTLTFAAKKFISQPVLFNVLNNNLTEFNEDIHLDIFEEDSKNNNASYQAGMVAECTVTILFDDLTPPAGSVDEFWNPDYSDAMADRQNGSLVPHPGTEALSEVYGLAVMPNDQTIIGGAFSTYTDLKNTYTVNGICRLNTDGSRDTTFISGNGINVNPGGEFIRSVALSGNQVVIGGHFSSYDGVGRSSVARLNANGSLDTTFNRGGGGANGTVWSVLVQDDGKVLIGGDFTTYYSTPRDRVARLNTDGTLDTTFDPSNILSGPVYSLALSPLVVASLTRNDTVGTNEDVRTLNLGAVTAGTLTVNYNFFAMTNDLRVFYGDTNVTAGTGVLIYDTGSISNGAATFVIPFGPTGGLTANQLTFVVNQGGSTNGSTAWRYTASVSVPQFLVGGLFNVAGQGYANIARLNKDGSLDTSFNPGTGADNAVRALASQPNGQIVAGGAFTHVNGIAYNRLVRLNSNGSIDPNFFVGTGADNTVYNITPSSAGTMYIGGTFTSFNGTHRLGFARLNTDGTVDTSFLDTAYNQFAGLTRIHFIDPPGTVYASGIQGDGNVMIAGSFSQVGGGQFDENIRPGDYTFDPNLGVFLNQNVWPEPKTREGVRNRGNVARLIGGATPGPGNIGLAAGSYGANKSQSLESVTLTRTNGTLGYASANFSVLPGLAQSGVDYAYEGTAPLYPIAWEYSGPTRVHSDGFGGGNGLMTDGLGDWTISFGLVGPAAVNVSIINSTSSSGNLSAQFQLANPAGADQFYLGGQNIPLGIALGESLAPFTIVDNSHQDGVFSFASASFAATNSPATVGIVRAGSSSGTVQVSYQTTTNGSTAVPGVDYQPATGVVTFNPGQTNNSFPVTVLQNSSIASVEKTVNLQLYNIQDLSSGNASLGLTNAVLRIINPNFQGYLNFVTNVYAANLSAGAITITVSRTVGSKGSLTVQCATTNGTAVSGVDYAGSTNTLSWNNGDVSSRTITIPFLTNNTVGPSKTFSAYLFNAMLNGASAPSLLGAVTSTTLVIVNDNSYGTFQFSAPAYLVNENGGYATVTVTRTGSALGAANVHFATADGTAFAGANYVSTNGTLAFAQGQLARSFAVWIRDDGVSNPPPALFFNVSLSSPSAGANLGSPAGASVHIVDYEAFNQPDGSPDVAFNSSAGMNDSVLALALQSGGQIVAGGNFTIANGTGMNRIARLNPDGTLDTGFLNGFAGANGSVNALASQSDDRIVIGGAFSSVDGITRHRIARLMTDGSLDTSFNPGSGADNLVFSLAESFIAGAHVIYLGGAFSTVNGTSLSGIARLNDSGGVDASFAPGVGANGAVYAVAVYPTNSVYDAGRVLVGGAFSNFNNYAVGNLVRLNVNGSVDTNFALNVGANNAVRAIAIQADGGILIGGDFTTVNGTNVSHIARLNDDGSLDKAFAANVAASVNGVVNAIAVQADNRIVLVGDFTQANGVTRHGITRLMPDGTVDPTINFGDGANGAIDALVIQPADGMLVIGGGFTQFNDQPHDHIARLYGGSTTGSGAFEFSSPTYQVDEKGSFALINIRRTGGTVGPNADGSGDVFIHFATSPGTAVPGVNYSNAAANVDFPPGEVLETVRVPVMDDFVITPNLTVNLALSNPTPPAGIGDQATAVLTIINTDSSVSFSSAAYQVPKNTPIGVATIGVLRQGSTSGSCTVAFATTTNGTATAGVDYYPTNVTVTFNPGDSNVTVQIPIINNIIPEGDRTVTMVLTNAVNTLFATDSITNATLTIKDSVIAPGQLSFATNSYAVVKGNTTVYLTVVRTAGSSGNVSVDYVTVPGTATPGLNYVTASGTLTLNDGTTSNTIPIAILDNSLVQGPVNFSVVLSNPTGGATLASPTNATVTILEKNIGLAFTAATNTVSETAGFVTLNVVRLYGISNVTTVHYATTNVTALSNVNYIATSGTLTFNPGESLKAIIVPLLYDTNVTGDLTFTVGLSSPSAPAQLMPPSFTTVVVQDVEAGLSFTNAAMSVPKNAGSVLITVVCFNPGAEPVIVDSNTVPLSVHYATSDGTAVAGQDYDATSGTLVFTNGIATNSFTVIIKNNGSVTGDRTFNVTLSNPTPPGRLVPPSTLTVTIIDSNPGLRFSSPTYTVLKTNVAATINVFRTGFTNSVVSVNYIATNGTAVAGLNYVPTAGVLVFTNGVTNQAFTVTVINNGVVQPDVTVLLQLFGPSNAILVPPSAATLTIHDNTGSYVVPSGSTLVSESGAGAPNGIIDSNETVTLLFAFRDAGGTNVDDLKATLLATNGITAPTSPNGTPTQDYGFLAYLGHSVSRQFTFTAHGTNGQQIVATFLLTNNAANIGTAVFGYTLGSWIATYSNTAPIIINDAAPATPYPSTINVSGLSGTVVKTTLTWTNVSHTSPSDIDALLVAPNQFDTLFMAHAGGSTNTTHVTLTFDDAATNSLPRFDQITNGVYKPTGYLPVTPFP